MQRHPQRKSCRESLPWFQLVSGQSCVCSMATRYRVHPHGVLEAIPAGRDAQASRKDGHQAGQIRILPRVIRKVNDSLQEAGHCVSCGRSNLVMTEG
jgi:hypothetical protein